MVSESFQQIGAMPFKNVMRKQRTLLLMIFKLAIIKQ